MKIFAAMLALVMSSAVAQEILEVVCGRDAIVVRFNKQTADAVGFGMNQLHFNDNRCTFDEVSDGYYIKTMNPPSSCDTQIKANDTHTVFTNTISIGDVITHPYAINTIGPNNRNLISVKYECTYEIDLRLSAASIPNITFISIPVSDAIGEGVFQVAMGIYKSGAYREVYADGAPTLQPEETAYLGITMVNDTSSNIFIRIRRCWATVGEDPESNQYYDLIKDSCPVDDAVEDAVRVTQNGRSHQALWQTEVFKIVRSNTIWLHCDISICVTESCPVDCEARRRRRKHSIEEIEENVYTITVGPVSKSTSDIDLHGPEVNIVTNDTDTLYPHNEDRDGLIFIRFSGAVLRVAMEIYKTGAYREVYTDGAPTLQPEETAYVGITVTGSDVFILMRRCWATVGADPESNQYYDLIKDSCHVDDAVEDAVRVTQNGRSHQALWQTEVFKIVRSNTIWLHCDISICVTESCPVDCDARRRRRNRSIEKYVYTLTIGPVSKSISNIYLLGPSVNIVTDDTDTLYSSKQDQDTSKTNDNDINTLITVLGSIAALSIIGIALAFVLGR